MCVAIYWREKGAMVRDETKKQGVVSGEAQVSKLPNDVSPPELSGVSRQGGLTARLSTQYTIDDYIFFSYNPTQCRLAFNHVSLVANYNSRSRTNRITNI